MTPSTPGNDRAFHALAAEEVARTLGVDPQRGRGAAEAAELLARDGPNEISVRRSTPSWLRLLRQFTAPLVVILIVAATVALLLGEALDAAVILGVVAVNAAVGFVQENKAVKAIDALARSMRVEATVRRDGHRRRVDARELVRGDTVLLESGDRVPADLRLVAARELRVDEAALTGESHPTGKDPTVLPAATMLAERANLAFASTLVTRGTGVGLVIATGDATEVGRINRLIAEADDLATPLVRKIAAFSRLLLWIILAISGLTFAAGLARGYAAIEMFTAAVALAVAAIPEGLPAAVTIMLAVGTARMARRRAIIRKLPAVEALGSVTVICSDKTGTLTRNQMTVTRVIAGGETYEVTGQGYDAGGGIHPLAAARRPEENRALRATLVAGALCNDASLVEAADGSERSIRGDPTEAALLVAAGKWPDGSLDPEAIAAARPRRDAIPFESDRQYMASLHPADAGWTLEVKGSVERIAAACGRALDADGRETPIDRARVHADASALAAEGLRVLAFARRRYGQPPEELTHADVERAGDELVFVGLQGMLDPPRAEAIEAVTQCQAAGIAVKMITGDHARTAGSIAARLGIRGRHEPDGGLSTLTGAELAEVNDERLPREADEVAVFARMTPEEKLRLVRALQGRGHVVAMTGDGVNDAPALRQADIGVAMGQAGTEVAKDAADIVLADDNFASIEAAVEEGRTVYANLTKFLAWTLPTNGGESLVILSAILLGWTLPIVPVHALYVNMTTAVLLGMPLIFEPRDPEVMKRPPLDPKRPLFGFEMLMRTAFVSLILCVGAMAVFHAELARVGNEMSARTAAISVIVVGEILYLFPTRAMLRPAWAVPPFSNPILWAGIAAMVLVHLAFVYAPPLQLLFGTAPLDATAWGEVTLAALAVPVLVEIEKAIRRALAPARRVDTV